MSRLYLRRVVLDVEPEGGSGRRIEQLRIKFNIEKTNDSSPNTARIEIYNLSDASRGILESGKTRVILHVGYQDTVEAIFSGDVSKLTHKNKTKTKTKNKTLSVTHHSDGPDVVTTIEVADGDNRYRNARFNSGFPPTTNLQVILDSCQTKLGLAKGTQEGIPNKTYAHGFSHSGLVREALNDLCQANDLEWSIQNEKLQILPKSAASSEDEIYLTSDTGLIGSPNKTAKGVEFVSLVQPRLIPGKKVSLSSRLVTGTFKLQKVVHRGDAHQGDFYSMCEATA